MKKFIVWELATCRIANTVEAETKEEAIEKMNNYEKPISCELEEVIERLQLDEADEVLDD